MKSSEIIDKALSNLSPETWGKGGFQPAPGKYCFLGHLYAAGSGEYDISGLDINPMSSKEVERVWVLADKWLPIYTDGFWNHIDDWNDDPNTSFEDVMLGMKHFREWAALEESDASNY